MTLLSEYKVWREPGEAEIRLMTAILLPSVRGESSLIAGRVSFLLTFSYLEYAIYFSSTILG